MATGILELSLGPVAREGTVHITVVGLPAYVTVLSPPPLRLVLVPELSTLSLSVVQAENRRLASRDRAAADYMLRAEAIGSDGRPFAVSWSELALVATLIGGSAEHYAVSSLTAVVGQPGLSTAALTVVLGAADPAAILELSLSGFAAGGRIAHSPIELTVQRVSRVARAGRGYRAEHAAPDRCRSVCTHPDQRDRAGAVRRTCCAGWWPDSGACRYRGCRGGF